MNKQEQTEGLRKINDLDFTQLKRGLLRDYLVGIDSINESAKLYKNFLKLRFLYPERIIVPSKAVTLFWRHHIYYTEMYMQNCVDVFGKYLHHDPNLIKSGVRVIPEHSKEELEELRMLEIDTVGVLASHENWNDGYFGYRVG
jgi:hypothetical protein